MSFGQSHRQLVADTNAGNIQPTTKERASSQASIGSKQTTRIGVEDHRALAALVDIGATAAPEIIAEKNRKKEEEGYINAGKEEGRLVADSAADVWHNKLFGANASLRGAQTRIAEDNARNLYLKAQDLLENGGADSWDDKTWNEWRDKQIANEVSKYDSEGMKDHINTTMGKDFQKLERDRAWKHQEYIQAENRNTTLNGLDTIAKSFNADMGSSNPNRSEEDSLGRLKEIEALKTESGMSDKAFAAAVAQTASNEFVKSNDEFAKFAKEEGYFDDLDFEDQQTLEAAQRVHEMEHDAAFGDRSNAIWGRVGLVKQGNMTAALEAYDQLVADYPEAIPPGGRNKVREQVRQYAWANSERNRVQAERNKLGMDGARTGIWGTQMLYDEFNNFIKGRPFSPEEKLRHTRIFVAETLTNKEHANRKKEAENQGTVYERTPLTIAENNAMYADNAAFVGQMMQTSGVYLPEVSALTSEVMISINHKLAEMTGLEGEELKEQLVAINSIYTGNSTVRQMMSEQMGPDFSKMEYVHNKLQGGTSTADIEKALAEGKGVSPATPTSAKAAATSGSAPEHIPSDWDMKSMYNEVVDKMGSKKFLLFWGGAENSSDIQGELAQAYSQSLTDQKSTSDSAKDIAKGTAVDVVQNKGSIISTGNGNEFISGIGQFEKELKVLGYEDFDEYLKELGQNEIFMAQVRKDSEQPLQPWSIFKNPLTSDGANIVALEDGRIQLIIPRDDLEKPYKKYLELPKPEEVPAHIAQDARRAKKAMTIVDDPEKWHDLTGKQTPREELDASLNKSIVVLSGIAGMPAKQRRSKELNITQAERDAYMPAHLYNDALFQREQIAVDKVVRNERLLEKFLESEKAINKRNNVYNNRKTKSKDDPEQPSDIPFYRQGDDRNALRELQKIQLEEFDKQQIKLRDRAVRDRAEQ